MLIDVKAVSNLQKTKKMPIFTVLRWRLYGHFFLLTDPMNTSQPIYAARLRC